MRSFTFRTVICSALLLTPIAAAADLRDLPPTCETVPSYGPVQMIGCKFDGIPNFTVRMALNVRNRSTHGLAAFSTRQRWYDKNGNKINDLVVRYNDVKLDSGDKAVVEVPDGDAGAAVADIKISIEQATFANASTWVAGKKYHGKLLPLASATPPAAASPAASPGQ